MTAADHANTIRDLAVDLSPEKYHRVSVALDALQTQAEAVEKRRIVTTTVQGDTHMNRLRERAETAEAECDRWKEMHALASNDWSAEKDRREAAEAERDKLQRRWELLKTGYDKAEAERDRLAKVLRRIAKSDMGWAGKTAQAALDRTEQP